MSITDKSSITKVNVDYSLMISNVDINKLNAIC